MKDRREIILEGLVLIDDDDDGDDDWYSLSFPFLPNRVFLASNGKAATRAKIYMHMHPRRFSHPSQEHVESARLVSRYNQCTTQEPLPSKNSPPPVHSCSPPPPTSIPSSLTMLSASPTCRLILISRAGGDRNRERMAARPRLDNPPRDGSPSRGRGSCYCRGSELEERRLRWR